MKLLLLTCLFTVALSKPVVVDEAAAEYGEWYEGDIRVDPAFQDRLESSDYSMIVGDNYKWPGGVLYYQINYNDFDSTQVAQIRYAHSDISSKTCIQFVEGTGNGNYVSVYSGGGCSSYVGRIGGEQPLSLAPGCFRHGTIMHEFLHALGVWHEHTRADRDSYVRINFNNIISGTEGNFVKKVEGVNIDHLGTPYDYGSVMHYGRTAFAVDPTIETITPLDPNASIGQRERLSSQDITRILRRYCQ